MAHKFNPTVLREYDIRGIVGDTITEADAEALGRAYGTLVLRNGGQTVCVGYDGRLSSPTLEQALVNGLVATGLNVIRVGRGPTPMLYYSVFELDTDGGIMITGSHNPPDYNGFKMMIGKESCFGQRIQEIGRLSAEGDLETGKGSVRDEQIFDRYVERILLDVDMESLARADLTVAWDTGNGAAGEVVEAVINRLPGEHILVNGDIDGTFPAHHPDPTVEENLVQLQACVAEEQCDLGLAFDGDGDRIGAVDSAGRIVWGDQLLAILSREVLADIPGATIIADVKASQVLFDHIAASGGKPLMWKTGHSLIKDKMHETGAPLAGEMSGHIFFKHKFYGFDDAIYVALRLLNEVARTQGGLRALKDKLPQVINTPELRFPCSEERKFDIVPEVHQRLKEAGADVNDTDGVRVNTEDGWWLLRPSNTQDVLVARCEGRDQAALERLKAALADQLRASGIEPPDM